MGLYNTPLMFEHISGKISKNWNLYLAKTIYEVNSSRKYNSWKGLHNLCYDNRGDGELFKLPIPSQFPSRRPLYKEILLRG